MVAINPYDYAGGIARSSLLARATVAGVLAPALGPRFAGIEPRPVMRAILRDGLTDKNALRADYLEELLRVGRRPRYATVARSVFARPSDVIAARSRHTADQAPIHLLYGEHDWSRPSDREANKRLLPTADFVELPDVGHFVALQRPDVLADLLNSASRGSEGSGTSRAANRRVAFK